MARLAGFETFAALPEEQITEKISRRVLSGDQGMPVWWSMGAGVHVEPHSHASEQIAWMLKGKMEFRLGSEQRICGRRGDRFLRASARGLPTRRQTCLHQRNLGCDRLRGKFQFILRKDMKLTWPRAETPTHWIVMGLHPDLDEGMKIAVRETIEFITKRFPHLTREEAYMIASVAVDYHVTQVVDGTKGIHGMIPKSIFTAQR
jgi:hypothetical protein